MSNGQEAVRACFSALVAAVVLAASSNAIAQPAPHARPGGGVVVEGSATIEQTAATTVVTQSSERAAIDWQSFDVGSLHSVTVQAPNAKAITLVEVVGPDPSAIAGRVASNGQLLVVNQAGATLYQGAQIESTGFVASGPGADAVKFEAGGAITLDKSARPNAKISNDGTITIRGAGLAALIAPAVANGGTITAKLGAADLVGAKSATLRISAGRLTAAQPTGADTQAPDGDPALVTEAGTIRADGGRIALRARAVDGVVTTLISAGGTTTAGTVLDEIGSIVLDAAGGSVAVDGTLQALGAAVGTAGGNIGILATDDVVVAGTAIVNVSGSAGGGTIAVGTTVKRATVGPSLKKPPTSKEVDVESGAVLRSNATRAGDGGHVTILSTDDTAMAGSVAAKGGPRSGNGGFVEISGGTLDMTGTTNVTAPKGQVGAVLLDPRDR